MSGFPSAINKSSATISSQNVLFVERRSSQTTSNDRLSTNDWQKASVRELLNDIPMRDGSKILLLGLSKKFKDGDNVTTTKGDNGQVHIKFNKLCTVTLPQDPKAMAQVESKGRTLKQFLNKLNGDVAQTKYDTSQMNAKKVEVPSKGISENSEGKTGETPTSAKKTVIKRTVIKKTVITKNPSPNENTSNSSISKKVVSNNTPPKTVSTSSGSTTELTTTTPTLKEYKSYNGNAEPTNFNHSNILKMEMRVDSKKERQFNMTMSCRQPGTYEGKKGFYYLLESRGTLKNDQEVIQKKFFVSTEFERASRTDKNQTIILKYSIGSQQHPKGSTLNEKNEIVCFGEVSREESKRMQEAFGEKSLSYFNTAQKENTSKQQQLKNNATTSRTNAENKFGEEKVLLSKYGLTIASLQKETVNIRLLDFDSPTYDTNAISDLKGVLNKVVESDNQLNKPGLFNLMAPTFQKFVTPASSTIVDTLFRQPEKMSSFLQGLNGSFGDDFLKMGGAIQNKINEVAKNGSKEDLGMLAQCLSGFAMLVSDPKGETIVNTSMRTFTDNDHKTILEEGIKAMNLKLKK